MKHWKRLLALLLSGAMALSLFACNADANPTGSPDSSAAPSGGPDPSASPAVDVDLSQDVLQFAAGLSSGDVVLTLNGADIHADLFLYMLAVNCARNQVYLAYNGMTLADVAVELREDAVYMANYHTIIRQKAAELGCLPTDAQLKAAKDSMPADTVEMLRSGYGLSDESIDYLSLADAYYDNVLNAVTHEPSGQELADFINEAGVFRVKHILLKTVDDSNQPLADDVVAGKKAQADDLLAQLQAVGADGLEAKFDELMNQHSEDGGLAANPDGYTFDSTASLVGGFREAALALAEGGLSGVVETDYGYHIMLRLPLADETVAQYRDGFRADALGALVQQWTDEADIVRADALSTLDTVSFFERQMAYQQALSERDAPAGGGAPEEGQPAG